MSRFLNFYRHGFVRIAVAVPSVRVADVPFNVAATLDMARRAGERQAVLAVFPELGLSSYASDDLFHQDALLQRVRDGLAEILAASREIHTILAVGAPLQVDARLFNCAVVIHRGAILGVAVKSYLPNYREFYEGRQFRPAEEAVSDTVALCGQDNIPFGADLIFDVTSLPNCRIFFELCEDLWVPVPPSSFAAMAGATVIGNLSASNITIGKSAYRHALAANQSARCVAAYAYAAAGPGESTTDLAWDGQAMIHENGNLLAESARFSSEPQLLTAEIDLDRLTQDRMRLSSFSANARTHRDRLRFRRIPVAYTIPEPAKPLLLERDIPRFPYLPADPDQREQRCFEAYNIQVQGLAKRLEASGLKNVVLGVSGGLDSTQALIVAAKTFDRLGLPRTGIKAYTLPGYATSIQTLANARRIMEVLGVEANELDIRPSCGQMFADIGHPFADGEPLYDVTFENVQAGERTSHLFRLANARDALVVGTGDLSELALGWCTYGVGDHMSHYNVNASVPKTLIQHLIRWVADSAQFSPEVSEVLRGILATEISPELVPGDDDGKPAQRTESVIGPYELQDFNIFYITRYGYLPTKVAFLAYSAWHDAAKGAWPDIPDQDRHTYSLQEIKYWLGVFLFRFFKTSQFKRSCVPNSPKVGSGGSLSPRGDYRAPSDSEATVWLDNLSTIPDTEAPE